ncbi:MAG: HAD-IIA family hydrolase [Acidimicrobiia bacterium]|nr:HAD-IIA family hydrolase [Acidimicrobiia bacterium]
MNSSDQSGGGRRSDARMLGSVHTVLCDLDGVVWLGRQPIPGAVEAIASIRATGRRVLFVTNNSLATEQVLVDALAAIGVPAAGDVVSSAMAAARLLSEGSAVLVTGAQGIVEAVEGRGCIAIPNDGSVPTDCVDAVLVGLHFDFDYARLGRASAAVRAGARYIATNDDATFPTATGLDPGGGSIVAAVTTAAGVEPVIAGKPHRPMADLITEMLGTADSDPMGLLMVGDRPSTDGRFAATLGCPFALVRTGVVPPGPAQLDEVQIAFDEPDLAGLAQLLASAPRRLATPESTDTLG